MTVADVTLWGTRIGAVAYAPGDPAARFEYDPAFALSGIEVSPLAMPLSSRVYSFPELAPESYYGLPGMLADSLPDRFGNAVIDRWLEEQGRGAGSLDPVEKLCYIGQRGMGALEYKPVLGPDANADEQLAVDRLVELASAIVQQRESLNLRADDRAMEQIIRVGTSAGGARAKAVVAIDEQTGEVHSGQVESSARFGQWIMKFDGVSGNRDKEGADPLHYTVVEYAYYLMALDAGITMSESRLYTEGPRKHFITRRFDRSAETGDKIHMQTLGGLAHLDFNRAGESSYEQAAEVARRIGLGQPEVEQLFRRMVFNVAARNQDDHVKNISFLMNRQGSWSLAPAYDMTYAYNPGGPWTGSHQMLINGKRDNIGRDDCLAAASHMSIKPARARSIIDEVVHSVAQWEVHAHNAGLGQELAHRLRQAFVAL